MKEIVKVQYDFFRNFIYKNYDLYIKCLNSFISSNSSNYEFDFLEFAVCSLFAAHELRIDYYDDNTIKIYLIKVSPVEKAFIHESIYIADSFEDFIFYFIDLYDKMSK